MGRGGTEYALFYKAGEIWSALRQAEGGVPKEGPCGTGAFHTRLTLLHCISRIARSWTSKSGLIQTIRAQGIRRSATAPPTWYLWRDKRWHGSLLPFTQPFMRCARRPGPGRTMSAPTRRDKGHKARMLVQSRRTNE